MKIVIIDTIIQQESLIKGYYKFVQKIIGEAQFDNSSTLHGTNIANIILDTCSDINVEILSLAILNGNKKGSLEDLLKALKIVNEDDIDVINISLGVLSEDNSCQWLRDSIDREISILKKKGTIIMCSYHNSNKDSYPANNVNTVGVKKGSDNKKIFFVEQKGSKVNIIINSYKSLIRNRKGIMIRDSNSYLCAKMTAIYCLFKNEYADMMHEFRFFDLLDRISEVFDTNVPDLSKDLDSIIVSDLGCEDELYKNLSPLCTNIDVMTTVEVQGELDKGVIRNNYLISMIDKNDRYIGEIMNNIVASKSELTLCCLLKQITIDNLFHKGKKIHFIYL